MLGSLLPAGVVAAFSDELPEGEPLHPDEAACVAGASPRRRRQFAAGRRCARAALARLGIADFALLPGPDRVPRWPPGVVGSIAHCHGLAAAAVARRDRFASLGLDVERGRALTRAVSRRVCAPGELERLADVAPPEGVEWPLLLFSAKESTYKCWYPLAAAPLGFHDVEVAFAPERSAFTARLRDECPAAAGTRVFRGRYGCAGGFVATAVCLARDRG